MSKIRVASWNAQNAFGDTDRQSQAVEGFVGLEADLLFIPETAVNTPEQSDNLLYSRELLQKFGYQTIKQTNYYPGEVPFSHRDHLMTMWSRVSTVANVGIFGNRYAIEASHAGGVFVGIHHEDYAESYRVEAANDVVHHLLDKPADQPKIIMGDFNAMNRDYVRARLLRRTVRPFSEVARRMLGDEFDYYSPEGSVMARRLSRAAGIGIRLADMSAGTTMSIYEWAGFVNADPANRPTFGSGRRLRPLFKIDHILGQNVGFGKYQVGDTDVSDHQPVSVDVLY